MSRGRMKGSRFCNNTLASTSDRESYSHAGYLINLERVMDFKGLLPNQDSSMRYLSSRDLLMLSGHPNRASYHIECMRKTTNQVTRYRP